MIRFDSWSKQKSFNSESTHASISMSRLQVCSCTVYNVCTYIISHWPRSHILRNSTSEINPLPISASIGRTEKNVRKPVRNAYETIQWFLDQVKIVTSRVQNDQSSSLLRHWRKSLRKVNIISAPGKTGYNYKKPWIPNTTPYLGIVKFIWGWRPTARAPEVPKV